MRKFLTSIAIAALAVGTAQAQGKGNGNGNGGGHAEHAGQADHGAKGQAKGGEMRGRSDAAPRTVERSGPNPGQGKSRMEMPVRAEAPGRSLENRNERAAWRGDNGNGKGNGRDFDNLPNAARADRDGARVVVRNGDRVSRVSWDGFDDRYEGRGLINGCPPGLAKKNNGCTPPGQLKQRDDWRMDRQWWGLQALRDLTGYRYYDGNLVRFGPTGSIVGYYPLLGGALAVGNVWPTAYRPVAVDPYYVDYYRLGDDYRYFDRTLYRVDPETQLIAGVAGLLTGDTFAVGQPMPTGYSVYNVPYDYRDRYVDGPDAYYRYSDGYVYQVDPTTQLIVAAVQLLT